jgi:hypothetical protein
MMMPILDSDDTVPLNRRRTLYVANTRYDLFFVTFKLELTSLQKLCSLAFLLTAVRHRPVPAAASLSRSLVQKGPRKKWAFLAGSQEIRTLKKTLPFENFFAQNTPIFQAENQTC